MLTYVNMRSAKTYLLGALGLIVVAALAFFIMANFSPNKSDPLDVSGLPHYTAEQLKKEAVAQYPWKIYWAGPRQSTEFELEFIEDGTVRVVYLVPGLIDVSANRELFYVQTFRDEAARLAYPRRVKPFTKVSATTPAGNKITYQTAEMNAMLVNLSNGGIVGVSFPIKQTAEEMAKVADSLTALE